MARKKPLVYEGLYKDKFGGMTQLGQIVKDAWAFELLDENETCEGWPLYKLEKLWDELHEAKNAAGPSVSFWPEEVRQRHHKIHEQAMIRAREQGWDPDGDLKDES